MIEKIDGNIKITIDRENDLDNIKQLPINEQKYALKYLIKSIPLYLKLIKNSLDDIAKGLASQGFINRGKPGRPSYPEDIWAIEQIILGRNTTEVKKEWFAKIDMYERDPNSFGSDNLNRQFRKLINKAKQK